MILNDAIYVTEAIFLFAIGLFAGKIVAAVLLAVLWAEVVALVVAGVAAVAVVSYM